jgi:hypothetical protein
MNSALGHFYLQFGWLGGFINVPNLVYQIGTDVLGFLAESSNLYLLGSCQATKINIWVLSFLMEGDPFLAMELVVMPLGVCLDDLCGTKVKVSHYDKKLVLTICLKKAHMSW